MTKRPSLGSSSQKKGSLFSYNNQENNKSSFFNNENNENKREQNDSNKNRSKSLNKKKTFNRLKSSKFSFKNREERNDKNYRIIKEIFDPEKYIVSEEELFRQGEGYCFGEWALIYREPRAASIYTLEDCVFFTLDEIHFRNSFLKSLNNSEYNKKKFALQNFLPFDMMDERQLSIYKNIIPITCKRNQVIFREGAVSDSIYLIYLGSFTLEKKYGIKQFRVLNLEKGSIVGLESIFEGKNSKYKCSLKLSKGLDVGLIFQLKISRLRPYIINKMKVSFKLHYKLFLKSWNDLFHKNIFIIQKLSQEKIGEIILNKKKYSEYTNFYSENEKSESTSDLFKTNLNSVLNIEPEDKYEILFKDCLKQKSYKNHKKNGSLRIFSSRQRNIIYEQNFKTNQRNSKYINIIKYFQKNTKFGLESNIYKIINSFRNEKIKYLNIYETFDNKSNNKLLKTIKNNTNFTDINTNKILIEDEEEIKQNNIILLNGKKLKFNNKNFKAKKKNYISESNPLKLNKSLLFKSSLSKNNTPKNDFKRKKYITIHFKSHLSFKKNNIEVIKKLNKKRINKNENLKENNNMKPKNELKNINVNLDIQKQNIYSSFQLDSKYKRDNFPRNNIISNNNNNIFIGKNTFKNINLNSPIHFKKENKILFNEYNFSNPAKLKKKKKLFKEEIFSDRKSEEKDLYEKENERNVNTKNKKYSNKMENYLTPMNIKTNHLLRNYNKHNIFNFNSENNKSKIINLFENNNIYKNMENNNRYKKFNSFMNVGQNKDILQEMNINNGFSISYFEKISSNNNINSIQNINKNHLFPPAKNYFKISFDSGVFKIPLIVSSKEIEKI